MSMNIMVVAVACLSLNVGPKTDNLVADAAQCTSLDPAQCDAFKSLLELGKDAWPEIEKSFSSAVQKTRAKAARIASRDEFGSKQERTEALLKLLPKIDIELRGEVIEALGRIADPKALNPLKKIVSNPKANGRNLLYAINALGNYPAKEVLSPLIAALNNPAPRAQQSAVINLGLLGDASAVDPLINRMLSEITAGYVRSAAAMALAKLKDKKAVGPLVILLANPTPKVRQAAVRGLTVFQDKSVIPTLLTLVNDTYLLSVLMDSFGILGDPRAAAACAAVAGNAQLEINARLKALWTMGSLADPKTETIAIELLKDKALAIKRAACECLGRMKMMGSVPALVGLLNHDESDIRKTALWALQQISKKDFGYKSAEWTRWHSTTEG